MAGLRAGYALGAGRRADRAARAGRGPRRARAGGAALGGSSAATRPSTRRRAQAARRARAAGRALEGTPLSFPAGHGHLVWLGSERHDGRTLAGHLAARRIAVMPGAAWGDDARIRITLRNGRPSLAGGALEGLTRPAPGRGRRCVATCARGRATGVTLVAAG